MSEKNDPIKLAVITGWHPYDVIGFTKMWREIPGIDWYPQNIDNWAVDCAEMRTKYDVVLFYNMNMPTPLAEGGADFDPHIRYAIEQLGESEGQGIFMLHHAILSYPEWPEFDEVIGIKDRKFGFHPDQDFKVQVAKQHPITEGVEDFEIHDETYTMNEPDEDCEVLLTTDYETSMDSIAWTRQHKKSPLFCFQCGHDNLAWENPAFRKVLTQGIEWCAGRR